MSAGAEPAPDNAKKVYTDAATGRITIGGFGKERYMRAGRGEGRMTTEKAAGD